MKKNRFALITIIIIFLTLDSSLAISQDSIISESDEEYPETKSNLKMESDMAATLQSNLLKESSLIKDAFYEIANWKYEVTTCNCKHKSEAFAEVLTQKGAKNVQVTTIAHKSGKYSHMVVIWEGNVYDPTSTPPFYSVPAEKYFSMIRKYGFNGLRVTTPYIKNN